MSKAQSKKESIQPLGDRVLLEEVKQDTKTLAGIILPDSLSDDQEMRRGKVIAVGPGRVVDGVLTPVSVKKGEEVIFKKWADKVRLDDKEYFLANEHDLMATIIT